MLTHTVFNCAISPLHAVKCLYIWSDVTKIQSNLIKLPAWTTLRNPSLYAKSSLAASNLQAKLCKCMYVGSSGHSHNVILIALYTLITWYQFPYMALLKFRENIYSSINLQLKDSHLNLTYAYRKQGHEYLKITEEPSIKLFWLVQHRMLTHWN